METNKTHLLGDDGTMDTVVVCEECGEESRYNYADEEDPLNVEPTTHDDQAYAEFVQWAIQDADALHECSELATA